MYWVSNKVIFNGQWEIRYIGFGCLYCIIYSTSTISACTGSWNTANSNQLTSFIFHMPLQITVVFCYVEIYIFSLLNLTLLYSFVNVLAMYHSFYRFNFKSLLVNFDVSLNCWKSFTYVNNVFKPQWNSEA